MMSSQKTPLHDESGSADQSTMEPPQGLDRRRLLLDGAVSGFALAASGLVEPRWFVAEASAADHPVRRIQRRAAKRRDRKRHRLKQKRIKQRRQRGPANSPGTGLGVGRKVLRLSLVNSSNLDTIAKLWTGTNDWSEASGPTGLVIDPNTTIGPYDTADQQIGIEFFNHSERPFIWVKSTNGANATTTWQIGGIVGKDGYYGGTVLVDHFGLDPGDAVTKVINFGPQGGGPETYRVTFSREKDTRDYMIFTITITNP